MPGRSPEAELRSPLTAVLVDGPSMQPTLRAGDCLLVRPGVPVNAGDVVVARFPQGPDRLVVKRAVRATEDGHWWVESDNPEVADDSRRYGPAEVLAKVVLRYWPPASIGRLRSSV